jgi:hypothetical protein
MNRHAMKWMAMAVVILSAGATAANLAAERPAGARVTSATAVTSAATRGVTAAATAPVPVPQFDSEAQCVSAVPRAWGEYKGGSAQSGLAFQAPDGTLRFLTNLPCGAQAVVALKIIRTGNGSN